MTDRFERHNLVPGWDQARLARATVVVLGVGALGNEVARVLALAGVGRLILCDPDRVARSNLSRAVLFRERDVGRLKAEVAAEALVDLSPGLHVDVRPKRLANGVGLAELRDADLAIGCLDSMAARLQLAGRCALVRARWIDGGTHPWGGEVRPYLDPDGPCYGCTLTEAERAISDAPWTCLDASSPAAEGASAPTSAAVGSWLALVAVRYLMGLSTPAQTMAVDGGRGVTRLVEVRRDPTCPHHHPLAEVTPVTAGSRSCVGDLRAALGAGEVPELWEPVQERVECAACGFSEARWGLPRVEPCPRCGHALRPRTRLTLEGAPEGLILEALGVPPREILPVRMPGGGLRCVELSQASGGRQPPVAAKTGG